MNEEKIIEISKHCYDSMQLRGVSENEVIDTIKNSQKIFIKGIRYFTEKEFLYNAYWYNHWYRFKKVKIIFADEFDKYIAITVLSFYY